MISDENLNIRTSEEKSFQTEMCVYKGREGMTKTKAGGKDEKYEKQKMEIIRGKQPSKLQITARISVQLQ